VTDVPADPGANVQEGVTVYFLGGGQNRLYVEVDGQWVEYVRSAPPSGAQARVRTLPAEDNGMGQDSQTGPVTQTGPVNQTGPVHWAGYTCPSPDEITREPRRRVYYDPAARPDLFPATDGQPTMPLPVLELTGDPGDPAPWLDPKTGERFSPERASPVRRLLRYAPRKPFTAPAAW